MLYSNNDTLISLRPFLSNPYFWVNDTLRRAGARLVVFLGEEKNPVRELFRLSRQELEELKKELDARFGI